MNRAHVGLKVKLAAALLALTDRAGNLLINHHEAKTLTADEITPMLRAEHRDKTAKKDIPQIAKANRLARAQAIHNDVLARKGGAAQSLSLQRQKPKRAWPKGAKIASRGFPKRRERHG